MFNLDYTLPSNLEEQFQTNSWWKGVSEEVDRVYRVKQLPSSITDRHKHGVIEAIFESLEISDQKIDEAESHPVFIEARQLIKGMTPGDIFPQRLNELFQSRIGEAVQKVDACAPALLSMLTNEAGKRNIEAWFAAPVEKVPSYLWLVENFKIEDLSQRFVVKRLTELAELRLRVSKFKYPFHESDYLAAKVGENNRDRADYLAYRVYDPLWLSAIEEFAPDYISFPLRWAGSLFSIGIMQKLYERHKAGKDVLADLIPHFQNGENLNLLENAIASCPVTAKQGALFREIVSSFHSSHYKICSRSLLALIEGLIWDFAWWWNQLNGSVFDSATNRADYQNSNFKLINKKTKAPINTDPSIGLLLRNTTFGDEFYFEFVEYFCEELFRERNPVLHGRDSEYGDDKKAAALFLAVQIIEKKITSAFSSWFAEECIRTYEESKTKAASN